MDADRLLERRYATRLRGNGCPWVETHGYLRMSLRDREWFRTVRRSSRRDDILVRLLERRYATRLRGNGCPWVETHGYLRMSLRDREWFRTVRRSSRRDDILVRHRDAAIFWRLVPAAADTAG